MYIVSVALVFCAENFNTCEINSRIGIGIVLGFFYHTQLVTLHPHPFGPFLCIVSLQNNLFSIPTYSYL